MKWYYNDGSSQQGPFDEAQFNALIKGGLIKADTYVWKEGSESWVLANVSDFASYFAPQPPPFRPNPFVAQPPPFGSPPATVPPNNNALIYPSTPPRSVGWMTFWGAVWPGLGPLICGQTTKGVVCMIAACLLNILTAETISFGTISLLMMILGGIDAYMVAKKLARKEPVQEWEFFPQ